MKKEMKFIFVLLIFSLQACYTFTGASIAPGTKTYSVLLFENKAPLIIPTLSFSFTEALKNRITGSLPLNLAEGNSGDILFQGTITNFHVAPIAITSQGGSHNQGEAMQNRLTISVRVKYTNTKDEKTNFEETFSKYRDFPGFQSLSQVQDALIDEITQDLIEDIFNKAFSNW